MAIVNVVPLDLDFVVWFNKGWSHWFGWIRSGVHISHSIMSEFQTMNYVTQVKQKGRVRAHKGPDDIKGYIFVMYVTPSVFHMIQT